MSNKNVFLSVVLATHNEEKNIVRCLQAVQPIADEIIVVDGESTDQTVALSKKLGATVINTTNKSNFHINKQLAMDEARGKYVLQMDADEVADEDLVSFIKSIKKQIETGELQTTKAWWINRKNLFLGTWLTKGGQYPDPVIRLYENGFASLPQKDVHEQMKVDGVTDTAQGHLLHYSNPIFNDYLRKFNTYTSFAAVQMHDRKQTLSIFTAIEYCILQPLKTFFSLYVRHRGYVDGVAGFVFALMSSLHHPVAYLKYWELHKKDNN